MHQHRREEEVPEERGKRVAGGDVVIANPLSDKVDHPQPSLSKRKVTEKQIDIHDESNPASPSLPLPPNTRDAEPLIEDPLVEREPSRLVAVEAILESAHTPQDQKPRFMTLVDSGATMSLIRRSKLPQYILENAYNIKRRISGFDTLTPEVLSTQTVELRMSISGVTTEVRAAVVDNLCVDLLIGTTDIMKNNMVISGNSEGLSLSINKNAVRLLALEEHLFLVKANSVLTIHTNTAQLCQAYLEEIPSPFHRRSNSTPTKVIDVAGKDIVVTLQPHLRIDNLPARHAVSDSGTFKTFLCNRDSTSNRQVRADQVIGYATFLPDQSRFADKPLHEFVGSAWASHAKNDVGTYRLPRERPRQEAGRRTDLATTVVSNKLGICDLTALSTSQQAQARALLEDYDSVLVDSLEIGGAAQVPGYSMELSSEKPIKLRPRHLNPMKALQVEEEIASMISRGIITEHVGPWAAPVTMVRKKDGTWRFCIDYRLLNDVTVSDAHPLPRIDTIIESLAGAKLFSVLDLASGYWQISMDEKSRNYASFVTQHGQYAPNVLPFGLKNAPSAFQRAMNHILKEHIGRICHVYIDDILIFSNSFEEHLAHVKLVLDTLKAANLRAKASKCKWFQTDVEYLGFRLTGDGILPQETKTEVIRNAAPPRNRKEIRSFMGLANYYRRFVKNFAQIAKPINDLLRNDTPFRWTKEQQHAFDTIKQCLTSAILLSYPIYGKDIPFYLDTDASNEGQGSVLSQIIISVERPLACWSSGWKTAEQAGYPAIDKELHTIMRALAHFRYMIEGSKTIVRTDHQPLKPMIESEDMPSNMLHARWISKIRNFDVKIEYRPGPKNGNADGCSRHPVVPHSSRSPSTSDNITSQAPRTDALNGEAHMRDSPDARESNCVPGRVEHNNEAGRTSFRSKSVGLSNPEVDTSLQSHATSLSSEQALNASCSSRMDLSDLITGNQVSTSDDAAYGDVQNEIGCMYCTGSSMDLDTAWVAPATSPSSYATSSSSSCMDVDLPHDSNDAPHGFTYEEDDVLFHSIIACTSIVSKATRDARIMVEGGHGSLKEWQEKDEFIARLMKLITSDVQMDTDSSTTPIPSKWKKLQPHLTLKNYILHYKNRVVLPEKMRDLVITEFHAFALNGGHSGRAATYHKVYAKYWWPRMRKHIYAFVDSCMSCQTVKPQTHVPLGLLHPLAPVSRLFQRVGIDFVGPLPVSTNNNRHILVIVDYYTHWVEAYALPEQTAERVVGVFIDHIIPRFGCPEELLSDRGTNFLSNLAHQLYTAMKTRKLTTTAYHPQTNGLTERTNGIIKTVLTHYVGLNKETWEEYLPFVLHSYRTTPTPALGGLSPFHLLYGQEPRHPLDRLTVDIDVNPDSTSDGILSDVHRRIVAHREQIAKFRIHAREVVQKRTQEKQDNMKRLTDQKRRDHSFRVGDSVFLRKVTSALGVPSLEKRYRGPFRIIEQVGETRLNYKIFDTVKNKDRTVHVSSLIPAHLASFKRPIAYLQLPIDKAKGIPIPMPKEGDAQKFRFRNSPPFTNQQFKLLHGRSRELPHLQKLWQQLYTLLQFCESPPQNVYQPTETANLYFEDIIGEVRSLVYAECLPRILELWELANTQSTSNKDLGNQAGLLRYWLSNPSQIRLHRPVTTSNGS